MVPRLTTARLVLDAFTMADVPALVELAGQPEIAATTLRIPHPFRPEDGQAWIASLEPEFLEGTGVNFAIRRDGRLVGTVGFKIIRRDDRGIMGYWIGHPFWNQGYATEAVRAAVAFAFRHFQLERVEADHFLGNDASGHVMVKTGMVREGVHPRSRKKNDTYVDMVNYGITRAMAQAAGLLGEAGATAPVAPVPASARDAWTADGLPTAQALVAANASAIERMLVLRHFQGRTAAELEEDLRVYGKSIAPDFARLSAAGLKFYLPAAQAYLDSEFAEGDWDFSHGLVGALVVQLRSGNLPEDIKGRAQAVVQYVRDRAAHFLIDPATQPFVGWMAELAEK